MCHDPDSGPPIPPIAGAAVSHDDLVLESEKLGVVAIEGGAQAAGATLAPSGRPATAY